MKQRLYMDKNEQNILLSAKSLTKSNVWNLSENDIITILENASKEIDIDTQQNKLFNTIKCAFDIEMPSKDNSIALKSLEKRGFCLADITLGSTPMFIAVKKRTMNRVTDLTYQNVKHISAQKVLDLIDRNFGGGWDSLSQPVKDVIQSAFLVTSTSMPKSRNVENSALYLKKVADGFDVLQVEKGSWVELIFAKKRETVEVKSSIFDDDDEDLAPKRRRRSSSPLAESDDEEMDELDEVDDYGNSSDEDDDYNEDELEAESYRTVVDEDPEDLDVNSIEDEDDDY